MKKFAAIIVFVLCLVLCSCKGTGTDTDKILSYQKTNEHNVVFSLNGYEYPMNLTLSEGFDTYRNGTARITEGALKDVRFEMADSKLKMLVGDLEYLLSDNDAQALYSLFAAFAIKDDDFISLTREENSDNMSARFGGKYGFALTLAPDSSNVKEINISAKNTECKIIFNTEKANEDE